MYNCFWSKSRLKMVFGGVIMRTYWSGRSIFGEKFGVGGAVLHPRQI